METTAPNDLDPGARDEIGEHIALILDRLAQIFGHLMATIMGRLISSALGMGGFRPFVTTAAAGEVAPFAAVEFGAAHAIGSATAVAMGEVLQAVRMN
jgi:hypothetical protein